MTPKTKIITCVIIVAILLGGFFIWQNHQTTQLLNKAPAAELKPSPAAQQNQSLGAQVYDQTQNPANNQVPEANAFNSSPANPIDQSYKNPFN